MQEVLHEKRGETLIITINRPEKRNAISSAVIQGIYEGLSLAREDPQVKVVVLRSEGEIAFCAGFDLKEASGSGKKSVSRVRQETLDEQGLFMKIWYFEKPVICAVQGFCIGGGTFFAMASDLVIAAETATFKNPTAVLGYTPQIMLDIYKMPLNKYTEWLYLAKAFTAEEMYQFGFVNEVVPYEKLFDRSLEIAEQICRIPAESMKTLKKTIRKCYDIRGLAQANEYCAEVFNVNRLRMQEESF